MYGPSTNGVCSHLRTQLWCDTLSQSEEMTTDARVEYYIMCAVPLNGTQSTDKATETTNYCTASEVLTITISRYKYQQLQAL